MAPNKGGIELMVHLGIHWLHLEQDRRTMVFGKGTLDEQLVGLLGASPGLSAAQLHAELRRKGATPTLRAVYKELAKLERLEVISKSNGCHHLRLAWLMELNAFSDRAYKTYTSSTYLERTLALAEGKVITRFSDLHRLDAYWVQTIMALERMYPGRPAYFWCPYQWFYLIHVHTAKRFYASEEASRIKRYHIIGSDTYLDRKGRALLPKSGVYSFAESPFEKLRNVYYTLVGEHLITVKLDDAVTREIHGLFASVSNERTFHGAVAARVFSMRVRAVLTIEKGSRKAEQIRKQFCEFFGVQQA